MSTRRGHLFLTVLFVFTALSAVGATTDPEARQCIPDKASAITDNAGRTVISNVPWVPVAGGEKVIYGTDDRIDVYQETDAGRKKLAGSVCALLSTAELTPISGGGWHISTSAYQYQGLSACAGEPFGNQPTAAFCTGFLVGTDIVATAGHCYDTTDFSGVRFVFGFEMKDASTPNLNVADDQVYTGVELLGRQRNSSTGLDYSVIRLDRAVTAPGATPLALRRTGTVPLATAVGVIGYPAGLPEKIAFGATTHVSDNTAAGYFVANLDTYGGNSGSPVFNAGTGLVEGILVRGNSDFVVNGGCFVSNKLPDNTTDAEQVSKATTFVQFVPEPDGKGALSLDHPVYSCTGSLGITLSDPNAAGATQQVTVTSGVGDTETVTLTETAAGSHTFTGSLALTPAAVTAHNGTLSVADGTAITVLYADQDNGAGVAENVITSAQTDCGTPAISSVSFGNITGSSASIQFQTSEMATSTVAYAATNCHDPNMVSVSAGAGTSHSALLNGLVPNTPYFVAITATDTVGNSVTSDNSGNCYTFTTTAATADVVGDGGFELGNPNPDWSQGSTAYSTVICSAATCGAGNTTGPFAGTWWAWLGGVEGAVEDGYFAQSVTIPTATSALLVFQLKIPAAHVPGSMRVLMDGTQLFEVTQADAAAYAAYKEVVVSVSAHADGAAHMLRFEGHTDGTGATGVTNFFVDNVSITTSSEGEQGVQVTVPGVVGLAQAAATSTLQTAGLTAQTATPQCSDIFASGQIISQDPGANSSATQGSMVTLVVSTGACTVPTEGEPVPVKQTAQALYDGFSAADTNQDGVLSITEAQAAQPGLTTADFMAIDTNNDGSISQAELATYLNINPACGCACNKSDFTLAGLQKRLGDLFLGGLSLAVLVIMAGRRAR